MLTFDDGAFTPPPRHAIAFHTMSLILRASAPPCHMLMLLFRACYVLRRRLLIIMMMSACCHTSLFIIGLLRA